MAQAQGAIQGDLHRSDDALIAGVCAGIAERYEMDAIVVRILAVLLAAVTFGLGVVAYILLWVALPREVHSGAPYDIVPASAESSAYGLIDCLDGSRLRAADGYSVLPRLAVAVALMLLFLVVAIGVSPMVPGSSWWQFWPLAFVIVGVCIVVVPVRSRHGGMWHAVGIVVTSLAATTLPVSLGIYSWETLPFACGQLWPLLAVAGALFIAGALRANGALMVAGAFCVTAFCLVTLLFYGLPGEAGTLLQGMPDARMLGLVFWPA